MHQLITQTPHTPYDMFDLLIIALLQFATMTGISPTEKIGGSGWDNDIAPTSTQKSANKIGGSGWDNDFAPASTQKSTSQIGGSGWDND